MGNTCRTRHRPRRQKPSVEALDRRQLLAAATPITAPFPLPAIAAVPMTSSDPSPVSEGTSGMSADDAQERDEYAAGSRDSSDTMDMQGSSPPGSAPSDHTGNPSATPGDSPQEYASSEDTYARSPAVRGTDSSSPSASLIVAAAVAPTLSRVEPVSRPEKALGPRVEPSGDQTGQEAPRVVAPTQVPPAQAPSEEGTRAPVATPPPPVRPAPPLRIRPEAPGGADNASATQALPSLPELEQVITTQVAALSAAAIEDIVALRDSIDVFLGAFDELAQELDPAGAFQGPAPWLLGIGTAAIALTLAQSVKLIRESEKDVRAIGWETTNWTGLPD